MEHSVNGSGGSVNCGSENGGLSVKRRADAIRPYKVLGGGWWVGGRRWKGRADAIRPYKAMGGGWRAARVLYGR